METKKLIIQKKLSKPCNQKPFIIYGHDHEILSTLSKETGIPMIQLVSRMIEFAMENLEIIE